MTSYNFIDEEECPKHSSSQDIPEFKDIYHGSMSREVCVKILKASGESNCYLVRKRINVEEDENSLEYVLSVLDCDIDYHFKILKENKYFIFANRYFPTFKCLINHYMVSPIIQDVKLIFGVENKSITSVRESLRTLPCYLMDNVDLLKTKELLHKNGPGSYLFRPRTDDANQFVVMFFDGGKVHKLKMDVQVLERRSINGSEPSDPVTVLVMGRNFFASWDEMVNNFSTNPIVKVDGTPCQDKLVTAVNVNTSESEIYRDIKWSRPKQPQNVFSIHGDLHVIEGSKGKGKYFYGMVDKVHGHLVLSKTKTPIELIKYNFIPIDFSVYQRHCFLLINNQKFYYISITDSFPPGHVNYYDNRDLPAETYAFRPYSLVENDKEVYHCTPSEDAYSETSIKMRALDRWHIAVKRHCSNTKDDVANEENPERHAKLYRYNRRLKVVIEHNGAPEISVADTDISLSSSFNAPFSTSQSTQSLPTYGQFEVMLGKYLIAVIPRSKEGTKQTFLFQDLPPNVTDMSVSIRMKSFKRKEILKELCTYTKTPQELIPRPATSLQLHHPSECDQSNNSITSSGLGLINIQNDPPSSFAPFTIDCNATIEYKELIILPFNNYESLSKHIMNNFKTIFSNKLFLESFFNCLEMVEYKELLDCFLYMAIWEKKQIEFMCMFFEMDLSNTDSNVYFRNNSCATKMYYEYAFQFAGDWVISSLVKFFEVAFEYTNSLSLVEYFTEDEYDRWKHEILNIEVAFRYLKVALDGINENTSQCPLTFRLLYNALQCEIERKNPNFNETQVYEHEPPGALRYRLLANLILFRFFCLFLSVQGERQDAIFRKISDTIRSKNEGVCPNFPKTLVNQKVLSDLMKRTSQLLVWTYSISRQRKDVDENMHDFIENYRQKTIKKLNEDLTKSLTNKEKEDVLKQFKLEKDTVCQTSSLSRRFNQVLEFLTKLQEDSCCFLKHSQLLDPTFQSCKSQVLSPELSAIIDEINAKKTCNNSMFIDRL